MIEQTHATDLAPPTGYTPPTVRIAAAYTAGSATETIEVEVNVGPTGDLEASDFVMKVIGALTHVPTAGQLNADLTERSWAAVPTVRGHAPGCDGNCDQNQPNRDVAEARRDLEELTAASAARQRDDAGAIRAAQRRLSVAQNRQLKAYLTRSRDKAAASEAAQREEGNH